jgi:hypothetical protein
MKHEEKINYLRIAAGICAFGFTNEQLDLLISLYELVLEKKGKASIEDAVAIELKVKERAENKNKLKPQP